MSGRLGLVLAVVRRVTTYELATHPSRRVFAAAAASATRTASTSWEESTAPSATEVTDSPTTKAGFESYRFESRHGERVAVAQAAVDDLRARRVDRDVSCGQFGDEIVASVD